MAAAAGGRLGSLIEIMTEDAVRACGGDVSVDRRRRADEVAACIAEVPATTSVPGQITQRVVVLVRWQLIENE